MKYAASHFNLQKIDASSEAIDITFREIKNTFGDSAIDISLPFACISENYNHEL